jgi:single-stranded-DNA-specific exonuclease
MENGIIKEILKKRGITDVQVFLNPDYDVTRHDPFLLTDMDKAVSRIIQAIEAQEKVVIYGDYDVDGMSAAVILVDSLHKFGLEVETYTPNRFTEGYGLNMEAVESLAKAGTKLMITVDCGSLSIDEVAEANKLGMDVIITDHHAISENLPDAVAVINPHRKYNKYPFADLAGCGVAFKLVQALQTKLDGLAEGQEKWLLDLVALGTVCDIVPLLDENRNNVYWGIEVLKKMRRPGLRALIAVAKIDLDSLSSRTIGFTLGPRLNAAGRLETVKQALELLTTTNSVRALELAQRLDKLNLERRTTQEKIFVEACEKIESESLHKDGVIVVSGEGWNEGVVGIVASKIMEKYHKPTFVISSNEMEAKGSGRSFGDFGLAEAIDTTCEYLIKGGGHKAAAGIRLFTNNIEKWREGINEFYASLNLKNQAKFILIKEDVKVSKLAELELELVDELAKLEPFGMGNEKPIFKLSDMVVKFADRIGKEKNHLKLTVSDGENQLKFIAFSPPEEWFVSQGDKINMWVNLNINEWQGRRTVEGYALRLEVTG